MTTAGSSNKAWTDKPILAVVGGIGSGKSTVARVLASHGGYLIRGDELGHEALSQPEIMANVVARWGRDVLNPDGTINRRELGRRVFANAAELRHLEGLVYPWIGRRIEEEKEKARRRPEVRFIVLDAAVILEADWTADLDRLIFVDAAAEVRWQRIQAGRGWDREELRQREQRQMPLEEKRRRCHAVIDNSRGLDEMEVQVQRLLVEWELAG